MQLITGVMYDAKPDDVVVYPTSVYVLKNCTEVQVKDERTEETQTKYQCDVEVYDVTEYIDVLQKTNTDLNTQMTQTQIGLAEVYELLLSTQ